MAGYMDNCEARERLTAWKETLERHGLELGEQQTLAHQNDDGAWVLNELPDYGGELLRCQRYYQVYTTAAARPAKALDCRPVMRTDPAQSTVSVGGATLYANSAEL